MLNHAFLITAHAYFSQLKEIIDLLDAPNHFFFINIDKKSRADDFVKECKHKYERVNFLEGNERMEVAHGGYSQIEVTLRLLKFARQQGEIDYFHLISGQDFPCASNTVFDDFFEIHQGNSYMLYDSQQKRSIWLKKKYPSRVRPYYFCDIKHREYKLIDFLTRCFNRISRNFWLRKMIPDVYAGWNWFSWHKTVVDFVLNKEKLEPLYFKRFHHTQCCDELIFHTLLHPFINELRIIPTNSLRYVNWEKYAYGRKVKNAPLILNEEEYDDIIQSGAFFCRKIHPDISRKLKEMLTEHIKERME